MRRADRKAIYIIVGLFWVWVRYYFERQHHGSDRIRLNDMLDDSSILYKSLREWTNEMDGR